ncbi:hypothetical protein NDU88_007791 [Pleurodeles waltl]|uniref:Uncharacterized protein n=1 Tax=Pleurodeles waltl TaxID=8319 RepID=A0AAV7NVY2_PLEWA|nr:hypothetical protein NDU88_007791 [Pleurodeles waltl]
MSGRQAIRVAQPGARNVLPKTCRKIKYKNAGYGKDGALILGVVARPQLAKEMPLLSEASQPDVRQAIAYKLIRGEDTEEENAGRSQGKTTEEKPKESQRERPERKAYPAELPPDEESTERKSNMDPTEDGTPSARAESTRKVREKMPAYAETPQEPQKGQPSHHVSGAGPGHCSGAVVGEGEEDAM